MVAIIKFCVSVLLLLVLTNAEVLDSKAGQGAPAVIAETPNVSNTGKSSISPASTVPFQSCTDRWDTYCWDCHTIVSCAGEETPLYQGTCHHLTPYCDNYTPFGNSCVKNLKDPMMEELCDIPGSPTNPTQVCTGRGYYPHINNAKVYFYCEHPGQLNPRSYDCPEDYVFDTIGHSCKRIIPYDCTGKNNEYVIHAYNPAYYAFCRVNGSRVEVIPYRCRDDQNFAFNLHTATCEYQCKEEGRFVDRESCENYYECYRSGDQLTYKRQRCGTMGSMDYYSKELGMCVHYGGVMCYPEIYM